MNSLTADKDLLAGLLARKMSAVGCEHARLPGLVEGDHIVRHDSAAGTSIPGEPAGIPGAAMPRILGRVWSSLVMSATGTWPSIRWPSTVPVWQERSAVGTRLLAARFGDSVTVVLGRRARPRR